MANLYGVANAPIFFGTYNTIGGANITCPQNVETNFIDTGIIVSPSVGWFIPVAFMNLSVTAGLTASLAVGFGMRINNGADIASMNPWGTLIPASTSSFLNLTLAGIPTQAFTAPIGAHLQISCNPNQTGFSISNPGTYVTIALFRAPDQ